MGGGHLTSAQQPANNRKCPPCKALCWRSGLATQSCPSTLEEGIVRRGVHCVGERILNEESLVCCQEVGLFPELPLEQFVID
jgi:hypothetical protein